MRALVMRSANRGDAAVGRHNQNRGHGRLESPVQKGKALNVQHVDFVNEENAGDNVCLPFLSPFRDLDVDLLSDLLLDLTRIP